MTRRPLNPTDRDLRKWRRLVKQARRVADDPRGSCGDLRAAAQTAYRAVAPDRDLQVAVTGPLIRLALAWPTLSDACLDASAARLKALADQLAPHINAPAAAETPRARPATRRPDDEPPTLPFRADIDG